MEDQPKFAVLTFFRMYECGPCSAFKKGPWETISADPELKAKGVEFILFETGTLRDEKSGKTIRYALPNQYQGKIKYFPYLDLRLPNSMENSLEYGRGKARDHASVKAWVLKMLETPTFKSYKQSVQQGKKPVETRASVKKLASQPSKIEKPVETREVKEERDKVRIQNSNNVQTSRSTRKFLPVNI